MTDLNDMLIFAKVAETQGISAAARALNIPKSRVSRRMAILEQALGARLFERTTRALRLTEAGAIYYRHCKRISEEVEHANDSLHELLKKPRGLLRISASVAMGQKVIAPHMGEFMQQYPEIELELVLNNRRVDLIAEGFDVAIRVGDLQDSSLISRRIGTAHAYLYASPQYLQRAPALDTLEDLHQHRLMVMSDSKNVEHWHFVNSEGEQRSAAIQAHASINDISSLARVAEGHGGVVFLPSYLLTESVHSKRLVNVLPEWRSPAFNFYVLYPSRSGVTQKLEAWIDFYSDKLG